MNRKMFIYYLAPIARVILIILLAWSCYWFFPQPFSLFIAVFISLFFIILLLSRRYIIAYKLICLEQLKQEVYRRLSADYYKDLAKNNHQLMVMVKQYKHDLADKKALILVLPKYSNWQVWWAQLAVIDNLNECRSDLLDLRQEFLDRINFMNEIAMAKIKFEREWFILSQSLSVKAVSQNHILGQLKKEFDCLCEQKHQLDFNWLEALSCIKNIRRRFDTIVPHS